MRQFASAGFRIWKLSREAKIIYTFFCALALLALFSSLFLYEDLVGPALKAGSLTRVQKYYGATPAVTDKEPEAAETPTAPGAGPAIQLAEDAPAPKLVVAMPYRKLLEITHFHLFTVPVFLLILTHLFMLTGLSARAKQVWITLGWSASVLHMAAPWFIRASPGWSWLFPLSGGLLLGSSLVLTIYPAWVMWKPRPPRRIRGASVAAPEYAAAAADDAAAAADDAAADQDS